MFSHYCHVILCHISQLINALILCRPPTQCGPLLSHATSLSTRRLTISFSPQAFSTEDPNTLSSMEWKSEGMALLVLCPILPPCHLFPFYYDLSAFCEWTEVPTLQSFAFSPIRTSLLHQLISSMTRMVDRVTGREA